MLLNEMPSAPEEQCAQSSRWTKSVRDANQKSLVNVKNILLIALKQREI